MSESTAPYAALLNWVIQETTGASASSAAAAAASSARADGEGPKTVKPMSEVDRKWLEDAMKSWTVDLVDVLKSALERLRTAGSRDAEELCSTLEEVTDMCENMDFARMLKVLDGWAPIRDLLGHTDSRVRAAAAHAIAMAAQNDAESQTAAFEAGVLEAAGRHVASALVSDATDAELSKALFAISAMTRHNLMISAAFTLGLWTPSALADAAAAASHADEASAASSAAPAVVTAAAAAAAASAASSGAGAEAPLPSGVTLLFQAIQDAPTAIERRPKSATRSSLALRSLLTSWKTSSPVVATALRPSNFAVDVPSSSSAATAAASSCSLLAVLAAWARPEWLEAEAASGVVGHTLASGEVALRSAIEEGLRRKQAGRPTESLLDDPEGAAAMLKAAQGLIAHGELIGNDAAEAFEDELGTAGRIVKLSPLLAALGLKATA